MMNSPPLLGIVFGLAAASSWGAGDFCGGLAARRTHVYSVVILSQMMGLGLLILLALLLAEPIPALRDILWAAVAGLAGTIGLAALYHGLATGPTGVVAPIAAVASVILPLIFGLFLEGLPALPQLVGFALALFAVWLTTRSRAGARIEVRHLVPRLIAGIGFGVFLIVIDHVSEAAVLWPLAAARAASIPVLFAALILARQPTKPAASQIPLILLVGVLDTGGNAFYALAARAGRLDVAAVLGALYPAMTVLLAQLVLKERYSRREALGLGLALLAVVLIAW